MPAPDQPPAFLTGEFLSAQLAFIGAPAEISAACLAAAVAVRRDPGLVAALTEAEAGLYGPAPTLRRFAREAPELGLHAGMLPVLLALAGVPGMRALHRARGIPEAVSVETMDDLLLRLREYHAARGRWGLPDLRWLLHHLHGRLHRLGRLQFMPGPLWADLGTLRKGDPVLDIHIPAGQPLDEAACAASCDRAVAFYPRYVPDRPFRALVCAAWLLDARLQALLPADSNLVKFQRRFILFPFPGEESALFERVFGGRPADLSTAPRDTALRRAILDHYAGGGAPLEGGAGIWRDHFPPRFPA